MSESSGFLPTVGARVRASPKERIRKCSFSVAWHASSVRACHLSLHVPFARATSTTTTSHIQLHCVENNQRRFDCFSARGRSTGFRPSRSLVLAPSHAVGISRVLGSFPVEQYRLRKSLAIRTIFDRHPREGSFGRVVHRYLTGLIGNVGEKGGYVQWTEPYIEIQLFGFTLSQPNSKIVI